MWWSAEFSIVLLAQSVAHLSMNHKVLSLLPRPTNSAAELYDTLLRSDVISGVLTHQRLAKATIKGNETITVRLIPSLGLWFNLKFNVKFS